MCDRTDKVIAMSGKGVFQWVPTTLSLHLNDDYDKECSKHDQEFAYNNMKVEYLDVKLESLYIPDINHKYYPKLYSLLLKLLQTQIIPMYAKSVTIRNISNSNCWSVNYESLYKTLLYDWCTQKKEINVIIKCEEYNYNSKFHGKNKSNIFDNEISFGYHIEGTEIEKISHVAIVYLDINDNIKGGNLSFDLNNDFKNTWKFKTKKSLIILFENMTHKIDNINIGIWNINNIPLLGNGAKSRRILTFWFCDNDYTNEYKQFTQTQAFELMRCHDRARGGYPERHMSPYKPFRHMPHMAPKVRDTDDSHLLVCSMPLLTGKDVMPLDIKHFNDLLEDITQGLNMMIKNVYGISIPKEIIEIIVGYNLLLNRQFLRNETKMQYNAIKLRNFRRGWTQRYGTPRKEFFQIN